MLLPQRESAQNGEMVELKRSEMRAVEAALDMGSGYVLNFSDRTIAEHFEDEFGINFYDDKYDFNGTSKANRLRAFIASEDADVVAVVLRQLWAYRETLVGYAAAENVAGIKSAYFAVIERVEGGRIVARTDALERFKSDYTLDELLAAIERDIQANKPAAALDRLHTYCMKKFAHLLEVRGLSCDREDPLHSRVGKYVKSIETGLRPMSLKIAKSSISVFNDFNEVRNERSFAHDNPIVDPAEARYIFDSVSALLRFVKAVETDNFGA